jgi:hypothetical protein
MECKLCVMRFATGRWAVPLAALALLSVTGAAAAEEAAIPYLTVLPPLAVRRQGRIVKGRIKLRAIIAADGLTTRWSIRVVKRSGGQTRYKVLAHGTLKPNATRTVVAVAYGTPGSKLSYDVTAHNADGGKPTPPQRAKIA